MRTRFELEDIPVNEWTREEGIAHLTATFDQAAGAFPALFEPYVILLADAEQDASVDIMRRAMGETIRARYPQHQPLSEAAE